MIEPEILSARGWRYRFAVVHDRIWSHGKVYLERRMLEVAGYSLRYHVFHASDPDRALHDHQWWFVTLPFDSYWEQVAETDGQGGFKRVVKAVHPNRFHFRPATYRHRVLLLGPGPVRTLVLTGRRVRSWGFWPGGTFVPWRDYLARPDRWREYLVRTDRGAEA